MATILSFDTLEFAKTMRKAGMSKEQSEALAEELKEFQKISIENLVTKKDLIIAMLSCIGTICGFLGTLMLWCFNYYL